MPRTHGIVAFYMQECMVHDERIMQFSHCALCRQLSESKHYLLIEKIYPVDDRMRCTNEYLKWNTVNRALHYENRVKIAVAKRRVLGKNRQPSP